VAVLDSLARRVKLFAKKGGYWQQLASSDVNGVFTEISGTMAFSGDRIALGDHIMGDPGTNGGIRLYDVDSSGALTFDQRLTPGDATPPYPWAFAEHKVAVSTKWVGGGAPLRDVPSPTPVHEGQSYVYGLPFDFDDIRDDWLLVATILFGVVDGSGGLIWVPGSGPIPVDPAPFATAPKFVVLYDSLRERRHLAGQLSSALGFRVTVARDEVRAVERLARVRTERPVVLMVERGSRAHTLVYRLDAR